MQLGSQTKETEWYSFPDAVSIATQSNKKILVVFRAKRNPADSSLTSALNSDPRIRDYVQSHFVLVKIDTSFMEYRNHKLPSDLLRSKIAGYGADPYISFFDEHGGMICRYGSAADVERFYEVLQYVSSNFYMKQSLPDYFDDCRRSKAHIPSLNWYSYNEGIKLARKTGKKILINAHWYSSPYSLEMKHLTYSDITIINYIVANFIPIQIELQMPDNSTFFEYEGQNITPYHLLDGVLGVKNYPETVFCESDGKKIRSIIGAVKPNVFLYILKYFNGSDYKNKDINLYLKENGINELIK